MDQTSPNATQAALDLLTKGWAGFLAGPGHAELLAALPAWLRQQRWFGAKTREIATIHIAEWAALAPEAGGILAAADMPSASTLGDALLFLALRYQDGTDDLYQLPLAFASGAEAANLQSRAASSIILPLQTPTGPAVLHDAAQRAEFRDAMLHLIAGNRSLAVHTLADAAHEVAETIVAAHQSRPVHDLAPADPAVDAIEHNIEAGHRIEPAQAAPALVGHMPGAPVEGSSQTIALAPVASSSPAGTTVRGYRTAALSHEIERNLPSRVGSAEQSNTNFLFGDKLLMKLFRRLQEGENPDVEIGRFLTEQAHFQPIAPLLGEASLLGGQTVTLAMLQPLVANQGDGWSWTLEQLAALLERLSANASVGLDAAVQADSYMQAATQLGQRTAEMHLALATPTGDPAFAPEPLTADDLALDADRVVSQLHSTLGALSLKLPALPQELHAPATLLLERRSVLEEQARRLAGFSAGGERIRIHGDYHLGQILRTGTDFVLLDFEGEPARTLDERRRKQCPLRDVAGMLRSFSYAAATGLAAARELYPQQADSLPAACDAWRQGAVQGFLAGYWQTVAQRPGLLPPPAQAQALLNVYLLEKALYELLYELNNRPLWAAIPLGGILSLLP